ncbi:MAG: carbamoyltransferase HypF, partial [Lachnospiraceae bacterium]|nr:carbamoyltransferase HypF [Lachnospiraceae bacterium]
APSHGEVLRCQAPSHFKVRRCLAPEVAPDNPNVGVMLPYAPVQLLLFDYPDGIEMPDCLVMTSGNVSGAPICRDDADAVKELSRMCDAILSHNRLIRLRADDSVMDFFEDKPYMIRRSRGYAPLPFLMEMPCEGSVLAVGGELKNTFCVTRNHLFYPSPYVGDMEDLRTVRALEESVIRMADLLEAKPEIIACDLHPKYNTTDMAYRLAKELHGKLRDTKEEKELPVVQIQHHYAHIASCMAENNYFDPVIGVSFDGTGYGDDGTIWGGEFLIADLDGYKRAGSIAPFLQIGGDASAKEGWRIAVSMLYAICGDQEKTKELVRALNLCGEQELKMQFMMADRKINAIESTSAGRLFDAVSAILGIRRASTFEGEASTTMMFYAERWEETGNCKARDLPDLAWKPEQVLDTEKLVSYLTDQRIAGGSQDQLAWEFHRILANGIVKACEIHRDETGLKTVALSGGVFQNRLLLRMCKEDLERKGFHVLIHSMIPPNDGGICLGQAAVAMRLLEKMKEE